MGWGKEEVKRRLAAVLLCVAASAGAYTIHRSFRGGYPAAVSEARQNAAERGSTVGSLRVSPRTRVAVYQKICGKVTRVSDGDTIWVKDAKGRHKVRLDRIDAPESDQPYGQESTRFLKDLVYGKDVEVHWQSKDRYGRILDVVYLKHEKGMVEVNLTMVKNGCAWHYSYHDHTVPYAEAEKEARRLRRGLWAADNPVNPYQWRKGKRKF